MKSFKLRGLKTKTQEPIKPNIAFLFPAYGGIPYEFWQSHTNLITNCARFCNGFVISSHSCPVDYNRNLLIRKFLELDKTIKIDYVFWIDTDMVFSWEHCEKLINALKENNADMGSGLYFGLKNENISSIMSKYDKELDEFVALQINEQSPAQQVDGAGFGFMCMRAQVLHSLVEWKGWQVFGSRKTKNDKFLGEDNFFCELAKYRGFSVWVFPSIKVGHLKSVII